MVKVKVVEDIKASYMDTMAWHKAPNGRPSNLSVEQWLIVRTSAFKNWFGDWENNQSNSSKVLDGNGEPLVVFHGSKARKLFEVFDTNKQNPEKYGKGFYFTPNIHKAKCYGASKTRAFFLNIRNPYILDENNSAFVVDGDKSNINSELLYNGFDGIINDRDYRFISEIVCFHANDIKSAVSNELFSSATSNIYK